MVKNPADRSAPVMLSAGLFAGNDMVPVAKFDDRIWPPDYRTRDGTNLGVANARFEIIASRRDWTFSYFYRQDWLLRGNRDTVDAYYLEQSDQLTSQVRNYDLQYDLRGFSADGVRLAFARRVAAHGGELRWGIAASLMRGLDVRVDQVNGSLIVSQIGTASALADRGLYNTRMAAVPPSSSFNAFTPASVKDVPDGWGYGFDVGLSWQAEGGLRLGLAANDLLGRLRWDSVPYLYQAVDGQMSGSSLTSGTNGGIIQGSSSYRSLTLKLKPKIRLDADYPRGAMTYSGSLESIDGYWFPQFGARYAVSSNWSLGVDYETRFGTVELGLRHPNFYLTVGSQDLNLNTSRAWSASAGVSLSLP